MYRHPFPYYYYSGRRRPSRLLWFLVGAGAATMWIKHRQAKALHGNHYWNSYCKRPQVRETVDESRLAVWRRQLEGQPPPGKRYADEDWDTEKEKLYVVSRQAQDAVRSLPAFEALLLTLTALDDRSIGNDTRHAINYCSCAEAGQSIPSPKQFSNSDVI